MDGISDDMVECEEEGHTVLHQHLLRQQVALLLPTFHMGGQHHLGSGGHTDILSGQLVTFRGQSGIWDVSPTGSSLSLVQMREKRLGRSQE